MWNAISFTDYTDYQKHVKQEKKTVCQGAIPSLAEKLSVEEGDLSDRSIGVLLITSCFVMIQLGSNFWKYNFYEKNKL